jgi:benzodiazapine receptor
MKLVLQIVCAVFVCLTLGGLSGIVTVSEIKNWYSQLIKPSFNPPNWLFGPAWTTLYTFMGIAFGLVMHRLLEQNKSLVNSKSVRYFVIQYLLNLAWSTIFFTFHQIELAFIEMCLLLFFIFRTTIAFYQVNKIASFLLIPYIVWVSFATLLTASIWYLN